MPTSDTPEIEIINHSSLERDYLYDGSPIAHLPAGTLLRSSDQVTALLHAYHRLGRPLTSAEAQAVIAV